mgnify:CR=1 FL=1
MSCRRSIVMSLLPLVLLLAYSLCTRYLLPRPVSDKEPHQQQQQERRRRRAGARVSPAVPASSGSGGDARPSFSLFSSGFSRSRSGSGPVPGNAGAAASDDEAGRARCCRQTGKLRRVTLDRAFFALGAPCSSGPWACFECCLLLPV